MFLGDILERLGDEGFAAETLMAFADLPLMVELEAMASSFGESTSGYASGATRRFAAFASDDDWLALMGALERADDPGTACLRHMLVWSLRHDREDTRTGGGCACGNGYA